MAVTVIEKGDVSDEALPIGELAAQMRLADGVTQDPEQSMRLRTRLRAAIDAIERRIDIVLLARTLTIAGQCEDMRRVRMPVRPVTRAVVASVRRDGLDVALAPISIENGRAEPWAVLSMPVRPSEWVELVVEAGHSDWAAVPGSLRQAVLLTAEALDAGEGEILTPMIATLLAPYRLVRIGGRF